MSSEEFIGGADSSLPSPAAQIATAVDHFSGPYRFLSNFYEADVEFEGHVYPTAEHAFQAAKNTNPLHRERVRAAPTPATAKRLGQAIALRPDWDDVKLSLMEMIVLSKFVRHKDIRAKLLQTGDVELVEGNTWGDRFWGVTADGEGANHLGKILMRVRDYCRNLT